ncbi:hypothetical protein [Paracerasibacillus soli]
MPRKPRRPCSQPGCPELTHERFCDEHRKAGREDMKGINVIQTPPSDTDVHGKGYVTVTLQRTRSARSVSETGS